MQIWAIGRAAVLSELAKDGDYPYVSASAVPLKGSDVAPRPLTEDGELQLSRQCLRHTHRTCRNQAVRRGIRNRG